MTMPVTPDRAKILRGHRTQAQLAKALGLSPQTVQRIESGAKPCPAWYILASEQLGQRRWRHILMDGPAPLPMAGDSATATAEVERVNNLYYGCKLRVDAIDGPNVVLVWRLSAAPVMTPPPILTGYAS